jgi:hypothetical protein
MRWSCALAGADGVDYRVEFLGESDTRIEYVNASVTQRGAAAEGPLVHFLGLIASSRYDGADPRQAHNWTDKMVHESGQIVINGVKLRLGGASNARTLSMFPAGSEWE